MQGATAGFSAAAFGGSVIDDDAERSGIIAEIEIVDADVELAELVDPNGRPVIADVERLTFLTHPGDQRTRRLRRHGLHLVPDQVQFAVLKDTGLGVDIDGSAA